VKIERGAASCRVADVLDLTVAEAALFAANDREVVRALQPIVDVGLDYVRWASRCPRCRAARRSA
jgi:excinuclease ABC subunit A